MKKVDKIIKYVNHAMEHEKTNNFIWNVHVRNCEFKELNKYFKVERQLDGVIYFEKRS